MSRAVFAIPGDMYRRTGGFIYEATVLRALNEIGCETVHLQLPDSFPDPTDADMRTTLAALAAVPPGRPVILDGFIVGTVDPEGLDQVPAPLIAMVHHPLGLESGLAPDRADALLRNEAAVLRRMDHIMVPSPETARILAGRLGADPVRITVAPPGFERPDRDPRPADPPLILSVGLLAPRKGHDTLIDALALIEGRRWHAEIVGKDHDSDLRDALKRQIVRLELERRVRLVGELDEDALARRFDAAGIFALATRYEGYGMVLSEAMLYGLPIVTCATGAVPDTVGDAARLVAPDDPAAFAEALAGLLDDPAAAADLAARARRRADSLPRWRDTARIFAAIIDRVAAV